ncbi:MAG: penicillin-binding transpeptidase domain-containing protein [Verrucomicrobiota bacterium JB025]
MLKFRVFRQFSSVMIGFCGVVSAQSPNGSALLAARSDLQSPQVAETSRDASDGSIITRKDARTITLRIPAPRGLIVDREGRAFAQNRVAYQVGLQFRQFEDADRDFVVDWARTRLESLEGLVRNVYELTDDELYSHYRHRRWLPLLVSSEMSEDEAQKLEPKLTSGLSLNPLYQRYYPEGDSAAHVIGYSGSKGKLPTGPINFNEPLWEESEGRAGFEKLFNDELTGIAGRKKLLFDENGNKLLEEEVKRPRAGGTLVTTLDMKWQLIAEKTLREGCRRGAFVVVDVITGEVLVLASRPSFDLNLFIPGISTEEYQKLTEDPSQPMFARSFQSGYPPASSFKPIVALAALNNGVVTETSTVYCPASIRIGRVTFNNWTTTPEGSINVKRALTRSCNTWFYQVGIDSGAPAFLSLARRLGMGEKTGLPLIGETPGLVPNDDYYRKYHGRKILDGDTANMSIGQGALLASPLQVAQAMAGIANGGALPKLQLVRQIQDPRGRVTKAPVPERKRWLGVDEKHVEVVREGMYDVVNAGGGTGRSAGLSYTSICGKTGTAQWGPQSKNQRLAWFAGFLSYENPRYAYAVLYEGRPNERVSGGRMAAPMVRKFFEAVEDDIKESIAPPMKALLVVDESELGDDGEGKLKAEPVVAQPVDPLETVLPEELPIERLESVRPEDEPRAMRAIPVSEDDLPQEGGEP